MFAISIFIIMGISNSIASLDKVLFLIADQSNQDETASATFDLTLESLVNYGVKESNIISFQDEKAVPPHGAWTIFPLFRHLTKFDAQWFVLLDEYARLNPSLLDRTLQQYDHKKELFIGKALKDMDNVIIHHFHRDLSFKYPDFGSAVVMSKALVDDFAQFLEYHEYNILGMPLDFSIDPQFELAKAIHYRHMDDSDGEPVTLTHNPQLCTKKISNSDCAVWREPQRGCPASIDQLKDLASETIFAVKTCKKFHSERLPIIKKTWGKAATNIHYISEEASAEFNTEVLKGITGPTERGHCMKTEAILKHFNSTDDYKHWKWLVIADDDTILSVTKLMGMLHCYNPDDEIAIGQRYGFRIAKGTGGYDYPTGGAGMIFSRALVEKIVSSSLCRCPTPDSPDDMQIGSCLSALAVPLTHSDRLHQGRPEDYPPELLESQDPISFHKFWDTDPIQTYETWFSSSDKDFAEHVESINAARDEL